METQPSVLGDGYRSVDKKNFRTRLRWRDAMRILIFLSLIAVGLTVHITLAEDRGANKRPAATEHERLLARIADLEKRVTRLEAPLSHPSVIVPDVPSRNPIPKVELPSLPNTDRARSQRTDMKFRLQHISPLPEKPNTTAKPNRTNSTPPES